MNYKKYFKKVSVIVLLFFLTSTSLIMSYNKGDENKIIKENASGIPAKLAAKLETKVIFSCNLVDRFIKHKHKINVPINPITLELTAISTLLTKACV